MDLVSGLCSSKVSLLSLLALRAASSKICRGYPLLMKYLLNVIVCLSKSDIFDQILLMRRNWLKGMLSLHLLGWAELNLWESVGLQ